MSLEELKTADGDGLEEDEDWQDQFPDIICCVCADVFNSPVTMPCGHTTCLEPCLEDIWNHHMKTVGQGTPECPWGCRTPLPPKSEWRISFHLQGTISILRAQNRKLVAAYEDPEQPGLPTNTSTTPAGAGGGAEDDRQQLQKDAPPLLRQRVDALHEEVNPDGHRQNLMILILGQSGVGKSLIHQFCINPNIQKPDIVGPTHGMDMKAVQPFSKLPLRFEVFDTAGQERFRGISLGNVRRAMGIVWVLDLSQEEDIFEQDEEFLRQCLQTVRPGVPFLFLANKIDIFRKKYAKDKEAQKRVRESANRLVQLAVSELKEAGDPDPVVLYSEVCALTGENIPLAFYFFYMQTTLTELLRVKNQDGRIRVDAPAHDRPQPEQRPCCK